MNASCHVPFGGKGEIGLLCTSKMRNRCYLRSEIMRKRHVPLPPGVLRKEGCGDTTAVKIGDDQHYRLPLTVLRGNGGKGGVGMISLQDAPAVLDVLGVLQEAVELLANRDVGSSVERNLHACVCLK